ncbi:MAG: saccharopine dehydrogenase family protein [Thermoanaerobaculia bacterium]
MKRIAVLGSGLVGGVIVRDLSSDPSLEVRVFDFSEQNLARVTDLPRVSVSKADLSSRDGVTGAIADADAVVGAVPGRMGLAMLETVIAAGKPISDISFSPENPLSLHDSARARGVTVIVDCGVSPGLSNVAVGRAASKLDRVDEAVIYVGGLPLERHWPFEYRSVFSPTDVIEEYTRPARMVVDGRVVVRPALSEAELLDFEGVGTLEAFNTDGLRTLIDTIPARNMREKTLRYPGHVDRMRMLRETGFFDDTPEKVGGVQVVPRELTEKLLFRAWRRPENERELTVLRVVVTGSAGGKNLRYSYDLFDVTDSATGETSMARTTGFPCAIMARLLASGDYREPGVIPPEKFAPDDRVYDRLVRGLEQRGVRFRETVESLD